MRILTPLCDCAEAKTQGSCSNLDEKYFNKHFRVTEVDEEKICKRCGHYAYYSRLTEKEVEFAKANNGRLPKSWTFGGKRPWYEERSFYSRDC